MSTSTQTSNLVAGGSFLLEDRQASEVFTREDISKAQQMIGQVAEEFMRREVMPKAEEIYHKNWPVSRELMLTAGELDLLRIDIPEAYGGLGLDKVSSAYVGEQMALLPSFGATLGAHTAIGSLPTVYFGNEAQREKYLPKLASGEWIAAFCLTETESGSDALAAKTKATLSADGTHYILNGRKMWITNGGLAELFTIFAKVDGEKFTAFLVERGMGVESAPEEKKLGLDGSSTTAIVLENCQVPIENVLGEIGKGHVVAFNVLNFGRLKLGSRNLGQAKLALNTAISYAKDRHQFNRPIASFGMIRQKIAEMATRIYVGDAMVWRTLGMVDDTLATVDPNNTMQTLKAIEQYAVECSIIKVWTSEALAYVVDENVQIHGGYGFSQEFSAERAYRDARITRIYEGTNEINRTIIPTRLLKGAMREALLNWKEDSKPATEPSLRTATANAKRAGIVALQSAATKYGETLAREQEVLGLIADIIIEAFAIESTMLRTEKLIAKQGETACAIPIAMTETYTCDAMERIAQKLRTLHAELPNDALANAIALHPVNTIATRKQIADVVIEAGRYLW
ncbi:MAG: acyl-CoA dehydrogenase family protein [Acidobacteria bacterium]|nr:acyl-CoA dehydrogenase family protein [Acidobacteriota bacterium]